MSFQQSASYVQAVYEDENPGGLGQTDLPVTNMTVQAKPIVPDGGTAQEDYDDYVWFEAPDFRLTLEMSWDFERTDRMPGFQDTLRDLVAEYLNGNGPLDFYVKYTGSSTNYDASAYDGNYVCPSMILDLQEDDAGLVFNQQAREKERSVMLKSQSSDLTWEEVSFTFD
jgi:hypothetical protein